MKKKIARARKGFSLVELLIAVVVLGILGAMLLAAGTAAQTKARVAVASNDIDSVRNAVYTAFTMDTRFMQMHDSAATFQSAVEAINGELDENWEWEPIGGAYPTASGAVARTKVQRDPWGNPYTMFIYTDDHTGNWACGRGSEVTEKNAALSEADSCIYLVIASAGPNGTGVGQGIDGQNGFGGAAATQDACVNNTDGIDDLGVVVRLLNGSTTMSTFGWSNASLGTLEFANWYFCGNKTNTGGGKSDTAAVKGKWTKINGSNVVEEVTGGVDFGSSLDLFPNLENLEAHCEGYDTIAKTSPVQIKTYK